MMVMNYFYVRSKGEFVMNVPKKYRNIMLFRSQIGYFGLQGLWASVYFMPVGTAACIFFTMPVWSALWAYIFIKEKL